MTVFTAAVSGGEPRDIDVPTGDYRLVVAMAVALAEASPLPCTVQVWCRDVLPDYGPYWYRVQNDAFGNLVVKSGI